MAVSEDGLDGNTQTKQRVTTIALLILATLFLMLRLAARRMKRVPLGGDDLTLILGWVSSPCLESVRD